MRIKAVYDSDGVIKAAAVIDGLNGPVPVAGEGTQIGIFDVPAPVEGARELRLDEVCTTFRVDVKAKSLVRKGDTYEQSRRR